jgi:hypothetical protein
MPLLDHFQPPLRDDCPWESFHSAWANAIVSWLNQNVLPEHYRAIPQVHVGARVEFDAATFRLRKESAAPGNSRATAVWSPPQAKLAAAVEFGDTDTFEVQVREGTRRRLVAAVELVSPANRDRPAHRCDFAIKCASYLRQHISVIVVDVVTERRDNLHGELMQLLELPAELLKGGAFSLYAMAYRLKVQEEKQRLELWPEKLQVGTTLPTLPLWIGEDEAVPLDLEASYVAACELLRIRWAVSDKRVPSGASRRRAGLASLTGNRVQSHQFRLQPMGRCPVVGRPFSVLHFH